MYVESMKNSPKKGMLRPTTVVEITNNVLMRSEYKWELGFVDGINSSRLIATGAMVNAYVLVVKE